MRFSNLAIIIYAARFISAASNYKTAHIGEERKGFICNGEYFYEAQYREVRTQALKVMKNSDMTAFPAGELEKIFEAEQPERLMMYDNGDAKGHYLFLIPSLTRVQTRRSYSLESQFNFLLDDSGRVCAFMVWKKKTATRGKSTEEPTYEVCSISS
ncbi:unnamed protein product [Blumeria hordei]|uniref:Uncharacterized protein n=1 Tax=Blumeria hordei TaxID=2867405 RepID=A0A383UZX4_BLUHO|nr:unnamed protein product [Blumeria hordei]